MNLSGGSKSLQAVPALVRGFAVLDLVAREPGLSFTELHTRLEVPKSSAFHLFGTLCGLGVLRVDSRGRYFLGLRLSELGSAASGQSQIDRAAIPFLNAFARESGLTCHLGVLEGHEGVYLCREDGNQEIKVNTWVGKRLSPNRSALGKILFAWLPEAEIDALMGWIDWDKKTPKTLDSPAALKADLALVRQRGWAIDDEEDVLNIRCVAAPVYSDNGAVIAAISAVGTVLQIDEARFSVLADQVRSVSQQITNALYARR